MSKKTIIIITSVLVLIVLVLGGYYFFFIRNQSTQNGVETPGGFGGLFPFGNSGTGTTTEETNSSGQNPDPQKNFTQKLRLLSKEPVAGAGTLETTMGTLVRYIEKATGHIYEVEMFSPNIKRISNTTIPMVYDAMWGGGGQSMIARYLKSDNYTVDTYSLVLKSTSTTTTSQSVDQETISGVLLPEKITDLSILKDSVFYIQKTQKGSVGIVGDIKGGNKKQVWSSPLSELSAQYINEKTVSLTTKPEKNIGGYMYSINTDNGKVKKMIGNVAGLTTLSDPSGNNILVSSSGSGIEFSWYTPSNNLSVSLTPTTFPEKCVWSQKTALVVYCAVPSESLGGDSLISWYKGLISLTDRVWKYDLKSNTSTIVDNLSDDSGQSIDVIKPILSQNEQYLVFVNKRDGSLWSLDLSK